MAKLMVRIARKMCIHLSSCGWEYGDDPIQNSSRAMRIPIAGVQRPTSRKMPPEAAIKARAKGIWSEGFVRPATSRSIRAAPTQSLRSNRPKPGQLFGKVENRRCRVHPNFKRMELDLRSTSPERVPRRPSFGGFIPLEFEDSAL